MRKVMKIAYLILATLVVSVALQSCGADGNHPGYEYMPNMYESLSYETYTENEIFEDNLKSWMASGGRTPPPFYDESEVEGQVSPRTFEIFLDIPRKT